MAKKLKKYQKTTTTKSNQVDKPISKELQDIVNLIRSGNEPMMEKNLPGMINKLTPAQKDSLYDSRKVDTSAKDGKPKRVIMSPSMQRVPGSGRSLTSAEKDSIIKSWSNSKRKGGSVTKKKK